MRESLMCSNCLSLRAESEEPMRVTPCGHKICGSCLLRVSGPKFVCRYPFCGRLVDAPSLRLAPLSCRQVFEQLLAKTDLGVCKGFGLPRNFICLSDKCVKKGMAECAECLKVSHASCPEELLVPFDSILRLMHLEVPDLLALLRVFNDELEELNLPDSNGRILSRKLQGLVEEFLTTEPQKFLISGSGFRLQRIDGVVVVTDPLLTELEQLILELHTRPLFKADEGPETLDDNTERCRRLMELTMDLLGEKLITDFRDGHSELMDWKSSRDLESELSRDSVDAINLRRDRSKGQQDYVRLVESRLDEAPARPAHTQPDLLEERLPLRDSMAEGQHEPSVRLIESHVMDSLPPIALGSHTNLEAPESLEGLPAPDQEPIPLSVDDRIKALEAAVSNRDCPRRPGFLGRGRCGGRRRKFRRLLGVSLFVFVLVMSICTMDRSSRNPLDDLRTQEAIRTAVSEAMDRKQALIESQVAFRVLEEIEYKIDAFKTEIRNEMEGKYAYLGVLDHTLDGAVAKLAELRKESECPASPLDSVTLSATEIPPKSTPRSEQTLGNLLSRIARFFKGKRDLRETPVDHSAAENSNSTETKLRQGALGKLFELLDPLLDAKFKKFREELAMESRPSSEGSTGQSAHPHMSTEEEQLADKLLITRFSALQKSKLLTKDYRRYLVQLLHERYHSAKLLLNSDRDGGAPSDFHRLCDGQGPTLVLVKSGLYVAGGVTDKSWDSLNIPHSSSESYVFSLNNRQVYRPTEFGVSKAIRGVPDKGPFFVEALEIAADFKFAENKSSLGWTYGAWKVDAKSTLFGQRRFAIDVYEVYQLAQPIN